MQNIDQVSNIISGTTGTSKELREFLSDKAFEVPSYQRNYAWDYDNCLDLWNDIQDGRKNNIPHYWGTITLKKTDRKQKASIANSLKVYEVIDGQQRLTTLNLLLLALSQKGIIDLKDTFLKTNGIHKLKLSTLNENFYNDLIDGTETAEIAIKSIRTNQRLLDALNFFKKRITPKNAAVIADYLLDYTFLLEFLIQDDALAVQSFVNLNDRGKDLTLLEKAKGLITFFSSRYLQDSYADLKSVINDAFSTIFTKYDLIKDVAKKKRIDYINSNLFTEDDLLRMFYHYFAYYSIQRYGLKKEIPYNARVSYIDSYKYIKMCLDTLHEKKSNVDLEKYIREFLEDFVGFTNAFESIMISISTSENIEKILRFLGISAVVYPLVVALQKEGLLDKGMVDLIETLDLRVFKVGGLDRVTPLYGKLVMIKPNNQTPDLYTSVYDGIRSYIDTWMPDTDFNQNLAGAAYNTSYCKFVLWEYQSNFDPKFPRANYEHYSDLTREHIFAQTPVIKLGSLGFLDEADYKEHLHLFGNLCLLESKLQNHPKVKNQPPAVKGPVYEGNPNSNCPETNFLGAKITKSGFDKKDLIYRRDEIVDFCLKRWP